MEINRLRKFLIVVKPWFPRSASSLGISKTFIHTQAKRTDESNPVNHHLGQEGLFYTIPESERKQLFGYGGFPKSFVANANTFCETCLMIRKPALEVINYMKRSDFSKPVVRYVLYGKPGCGKTITLAHVIHYAYTNGFIILHVPWVWNWFRHIRTEVVYSTSHPGSVNLPVISAQWLKHFQSQNARLLTHSDLNIRNDYIWNQRENTPAGSPLTDLVTHGINRIKYAADCIEGIIRELKAAARDGRCKVLVAVDGFNALFGKLTNLKTEDRTKVIPSQVTLTQSFLEATSQDWCNGAVVLTLDQLATRHEPMHAFHSHLPIYLLGKKGFEHIDPFIGVDVQELNDLELNSMLDYYEDRKWLQTTGGRHELAFVSNKNPYQLMNLCASL